MNEQNAKSAENQPISDRQTSDQPDRSAQGAYPRYSAEQAGYSFSRNRARQENSRSTYQADEIYQTFYDPREQAAKEYYDPRQAGIHIPGENNGQVNYARGNNPVNYGQGSSQADYSQAAPNGYGMPVGYRNQNGYTNANGYVDPNGYVNANGYADPNGYMNTNGYPDPNGYGSQNGYTGPGGYAGPNGYANVNGYVTRNGYTDANGYASPNGYVPSNGYAGRNGYADPSGYGNSPVYTGGVYADLSASASEENDEERDKKADYDYEGYEETSRKKRKREKQEAREEKLREQEAERTYGRNTYRAAANASRNPDPMNSGSQSTAEEKPKKKKNGFGKFLLVLQLILSLSVIGLLLVLNVIPAKFLVLGGGILAALWILMVMFQSIQGTRGFGKGCCSFFILLLALVTFYLWETNAAMKNMFTSGSLIETVQTALTSGSKAEDPFVVYLTGNDSYGEIETEGRSDVNILMAVNPSTGKIVMVTTPRDSYIDLPDYIGDGAKDKLTHVGLYGIQASEDVLSDLYDVDVDYYMRINFSGFQTIVDALGGVSVYSDYDFTTVDNISFYQGYNDVDGVQALSFVRERYAFSDGDFQRGRDQMYMIQAMIRKATSPSILVNYTSVLGAVEDCVLTDMDQSKVSVLVKAQLSGNTEWDISSVEVSGTTGSDYTYSGGEASVVYLDEDSVAAAAQALQDCLNGNTGDADPADGE